MELRRAVAFDQRVLVRALAQVPVFVLLGLGARHAVLLGDASWETGGALWFVDLTLADPTLALPVLVTATSCVRPRARECCAPAAWGAGGGAHVPARAPSRGRYAALEVVFGPPRPPRRALPGAAGLLAAQGIGQSVKSALQMLVLVSAPFTVMLPAVRAANTDMHSPITAAFTAIAAVDMVMHSPSPPPAGPAACVWWTCADSALFENWFGCEL